MSTINKLPKELLYKILNNINSVSELAQIRLVCKRWDQHAEKIMFSKQITITSNPQALVLYGHLFKKTSHGKLVRHIHFHHSFQDKSIWLMSALLRIVFTADILELTGVEKQDDVFNVILTAANESETKLLFLPHQPDAFTVAYSDALITFRHTLTSITIRLNRNTPDDTFWNFVDRLDEFKSLEVFDFSVSILVFRDLERILKGCTHLRSLSLNPYITADLINSNELNTWMRANVEKVRTLVHLTVVDECYGDLLEYLMFKYPNIKKLDINAERSRFKFDNSTAFKSNMDRVLKAIKGAPEKKIDFIISYSQLYIDIYRYFSSSDYTIVFKKVIGDNNLLFGVDGDI